MPRNYNVKKDVSKTKPQVNPRPLGLRSETRRAILAVLFFLLSVFLMLSAYGIGGAVGIKTFKSLDFLLGLAYYLVPLIFFILSVSHIREDGGNFNYLDAIGSVFFCLSGLALIEILFTGKGGLLGSLIASPLLSLFDFVASLVLLSGMLVVSILIIFQSELKPEHIFFWKRFMKSDDDTLSVASKAVDVAIKEADITPNIKGAEEKNSLVGNFFKKEKSSDDELGIKMNGFGLGKPFIPPPLSILEGDKGKPGVGDIKANANIIKRTLLNFGIVVEMDEISIGPSVTRYTLKPAVGVKLAKIVGLQNELSLALAAHPLRIEAPIPGQSLVGIEIPNSTKTVVGLAGLFANPEYRDSEKPLLISLGKGVSGNAVYANISRMPHLLIAGATGSGKSVTIHSVVASLLFRNSPESLKFIMIDPKRVELTQYNGIPHLLTPVITDTKKAILSLKWVAKEMDRRYDILETEGKRDIESYHKNVLNPEVADVKKKSNDDTSSTPEPMPYIVVIIDELADIMLSYPRELETAIVRIAQMSRAVGIHLILSTQRPSVNVITGLIKANVPSRVALQVASQIDSRTILDAGGAEKLLGQGDMLYISGDMSKPQRIQSAYMSENEVKKVVKYFKDTYQDSLQNEINLSTSANGSSIFEATIGRNDGSNDDDDELYEESREIVIKLGKASTSYLQRKLRVGYARAARLMDMLEERGVIGPADGAKPRLVLNNDGENDGYGNSNDASENI